MPEGPDASAWCFVFAFQILVDTVLSQAESLTDWNLSHPCRQGFFAAALIRDGCGDRKKCRLGPVQEFSSRPWPLRWRSFPPAATSNTCQKPIIRRTKVQYRHLLRCYMLMKHTKNIPNNYEASQLTRHPASESAQAINSAPLEYLPSN